MCVVIPGADPDKFQVEYHNFENPLYSEDLGAVTSTRVPPMYSRTSQLGPRGASTDSTLRQSCDASSTDVLNTNGAGPGQVEYDYISVKKKQEGASGKPKRHRAAKNGQLLLPDQNESVYESLTEYR